MPVGGTEELDAGIAFRGDGGVRSEESEPVREPFRRGFERMKSGACHMNPLKTLQPDLARSLRLRSFSPCSIFSLRPSEPR